MAPSARPSASSRRAKAASPICAAISPHRVRTVTPGMDDSPSRIVPPLDNLLFSRKRFSALFGFDCVVYMGEVDMARQELNVFRMQLLGARVIPVESGSRTLKDATNEAFRDWAGRVADTFYIIGSVAGPHPYPMMVRDFQSVIGKECLTQMPELAGRQPDMIIACVGGGSNAMGIFHPYIPHADVKLVGVEAAGEGLATGRHSASLAAGRPGVLHGNRTYLLQDADGQIVETHSISAGLDYPGVGPQHAHLAASGRASYVGVSNYAGWQRQATIVWPETRARLVLEASPPLGFLVLYSPPGEPFFCAEPVSHCTDAFNLAAQGRADADDAVRAVFRTQLEDAPEERIVEAIEIAYEERPALFDIRTALDPEAPAVPVDLAGRVVGESLTDEARQRRIVERFLDELEDEDAERDAGDLVLEIEPGVFRRLELLPCPSGWRAFAS